MLPICAKGDMSCMSLPDEHLCLTKPKPIGSEAKKCCPVNKKVFNAIVCYFLIGKMPSTYDKSATIAASMLILLAPVKLAVASCFSSSSFSGAFSSS